MGKVQNTFLNGFSGAVSRSVDDVIISVKNASDQQIPFGAPVFLGAGGAVPFDPSSAQAFTAFLGFAVRIADKTPETYPSGQFGTPSAGVWKAGDVMEVLVRGSIALPLTDTGAVGGTVYVKKADGTLQAAAGESGATVALENVRIRRPKDDSGCCEAVINKRNIL